MDKQMWSSMDKKMEMLSNTTGTGESKMGHWVSLNAKPHVGDLAPSPQQIKSQGVSSASSASQSPSQPRLVQQRLNFSSESAQSLRPPVTTTVQQRQEAQHVGQEANKREASSAFRQPPVVQITTTATTTSAQARAPPGSTNGSDNTSSSGEKTVLDPEVKRRIEMNRLAALAKRQERMMQQQR